MWGMVTFSDAERREFARNGFLVRDDLVPEDLIADAYDAVVDGIEAEPTDPDDVIGAGYEANTDGVDEAPLTAVAEAVFPAVEALVGEDVLYPPGEGMQVALNFPAEDAAEQVPEPNALSGHLDGYANFDEEPEVYTFRVAAAVYLDDVPPRGGGFTVWPGSHRVAATYFEDHALEAVGGKPNNSQLPAVGDEPGEWDYDRRLSEQVEPYEIAGEAGTVVLWHSLLTHTAGINTGERIRMAAISRFPRQDEGEIRREAASDLFEYAPAMAGVPFVEGGDPVAEEELGFDGE
jgi:hypothetical protein